MLGMVAELERSFIRERQKAGIERAKANGVYKGRKPTVPSDAQGWCRAERHRERAGHQPDERASGAKRRLVAPYQEGCILCTSLGSPTRCYP